MRLRTRLLLLSFALVLLPIALLGWITRRQASARLVDQYEQRVDTLEDVLEAELARRHASIATRLHAWRTSASSDARLLNALANPANVEDVVVLDAAGRAAKLLDLPFLQLQDETGRILSSAHYRNEFGRVDLELVGALRRASAPTLVHARRPTDAFLAFAQLDSLRVDRRVWYFVAGWEVDRAMLASATLGDEWELAILYQGGALAADEARDESYAAHPDSTLAVLRRTHVVRTADVLAHDIAPARWILTHSLAPQRALLAEIDRSFLGACVLAAFGSLLVALSASARITRPLERLAAESGRLDLDHLDARFPSDASGEIGTLARVLQKMTDRLRTNAAALRDAERRATLGDVARQVNHDLKNGIAPLRNVVRHLGQVAENDPQQLAGLYRERRSTIDSSLEYLDELATGYARLGAPMAREACDLAAIARDVAAARNPGGETLVRVRTASDVAPVAANAVGLRRVMDNLVANALDAAGGAGIVDVSVAREGSDTVRLTIADSGPGMRPEELDRIFDHFYTTKPSGTGLGLSIVRRLVTDFEGTISVRSTPGEGTTVDVRLPVWTEDHP